MKTIKIGRNTAEVRNDIELNPNNQSVSRSHAIIEFDGKKNLFITDSSKYGTYINGSRINKGVQVPVKVNELVQFGAQGKLETLNWSNVTSKYPELSGGNSGSGFDFKRLLPFLIGLLILALLGIAAIKLWPATNDVAPPIESPPQAPAKFNLAKIQDTYQNSLGIILHSFYLSFDIDHQSQAYIGLGTDNEITISTSRDNIDKFIYGGTAFLVKKGSSKGKVVTNQHLICPERDINKKYYSTSQEDYIREIRRKVVDACQRAGCASNQIEFESIGNNLIYLPNGNTMNPATTYDEIKGMMNSSSAIQAVPSRTFKDDKIDLASLDLNQSIHRDITFIDFETQIEDELSNIKQGDYTFSLGFPGVIDGNGRWNNLQVSCTSTSGLIGQSPRGDKIETGISFGSGGSGSPIFNEKGKLIAVHAYIQNGDFYGVPSPEHLRRLLDEDDSFTESIR